MIISDFLLSSKTVILLVTVVYIMITAAAGLILRPSCKWRWILPVLIQIFSVLYLTVLQLPVLIKKDEKLNTLVIGVIILILNILMIFLIQKTGTKRNADTKKEKIIKEKPEKAETAKQEIIVDPSLFAVKTEETAKESGDSTFAMIDEMLEKGDRENAIKYLRMMAFFAQSQSSRDYAQKRLSELNG